MRATFACLLLLAAISCAAQPITWSPIGPAPEIGVLGSPVSGRIWSIAVVPAHTEGTTTKPATMLIAPEGGGIWSSSNFETALPFWTPVADDQLPAAQVIHSLAVSVSNPSVVYAGGDSGLLLRSTDGGAHWSPITSNASGPILKIVVHPTTGHVYFASYNINDGSANLAANGVYTQTTTGFATMTKGLSTIEGAFSDLDLTVDTGGSLTLYLGVRKSGSGTGSDFGIWKYPEATGAWQKVDFTLTDVTGAAVSTDDRNLITFAADHTPGTPNGLYAALTTKSDLLNVFRFDGQNWMAVGGPLKDFSLRSTFADILLGLSDTGGLYLGLGNVPQHAIYQTTDRGAHWVDIRTGTNGITPHTDERAFAFFNGKVYLGNDGGINRFNPKGNNLAGPNTWESLNTNSLQTILVNGVGVHPTRNDIALVGSQDNSIALLSGGQWRYVNGDDSSKVRFDPDPAAAGKYAYTTGVGDFVFFFRSDDQGQTWVDKSPAQAKADGANIDWYASFDIHPGNGSRIVVGVDRVYESFDHGDHWGPQKSPVFNPTCMIGSKTVGCQATAISYGTNDRIWVAYGPKIFVTTNDGGDGSMSNWSDLTGGTNFGGDIIQIRVDPAHWNTVYLATGSKVWRSVFSPFSTPHWSWIDISGNVPGGITSLAVTDSETTAAPILLVGASTGVFISFDQGGSWGVIRTGMPATQVTDVQYAPQTKTLLAGLYGRGAYRASLANVLAEAQQPSVQIEVPLSADCKLPPVEGGQAVISYFVKNALDSNGWKTKWTVTGASPAPGDTLDGSLLHVLIPVPAPPITVSVEIDFADGLIARASKQIATLSQQQATTASWVCKLSHIKTKPIPWWEWDPEYWKWNPEANDIRPIVLNKEELKIQEALTERRLIQLREAIKGSDGATPK